MRYSLRTPLIAITVAGIFFGWAAYLRKMERYHYREAANLIALLAEGFHIPSEGVKETIERMALDKAKFSGLNSKTAASFQKPLPTNTEAWASAVYHQRMSATYHEALYRPWILLSKSPPSQDPGQEAHSTGRGAADLNLTLFGQQLERTKLSRKSPHDLSAAVQ